LGTFWQCLYQIYGSVLIGPIRPNPEMKLLTQISVIEMIQKWKQ